MVWFYQVAAACTMENVLMRILLACVCSPYEGKAIVLFWGTRIFDEGKGHVMVVRFRNCAPRKAKKNIDL